MTGKIIKGIAGFYYVHDRQGQVYACKAKGVFRKKGIKPLVGDNVEFTILDETDKEGNIDEILPRKTSWPGRPAPMWTRPWWCLPSRSLSPILTFLTVFW